jgi:hypothetical protein
MQAGAEALRKASRPLELGRAWNWLSDRPSSGAIIMGEGSVKSFRPEGGGYNRNLGEGC